jgi:hypothetical protein
MATIIKVQLGNDIRRLDITHFQTYAEFTQLVRTIFNISNLSGMTLMYQDEDKDSINIRSEMDMAEARRYAARFPSFKIVAQLSDGISSSPSNTEPLYPQISPEDIDLTNSFAELLTDSMKNVEEAKEEKKVSIKEEERRKVIEMKNAPVVVPIEVSSPMIDHAEQKPVDIGAEASFHQHLEELCEMPANGNEASETGLGVLDTVESKLKKALAALVEFVESLQLDQKVKKLVTEFEPSFAKFEASVIVPLNDFGVRASHGLQREMDSFQIEINQLKDRLQKRMDELKRQAAAPSAPIAEAQVAQDAHVAVVAPPQIVHDQEPPVLHNAMKDLQTLESMGFTDRRRNLELLAIHKGDLNAIVNILLA